MDKLPTYQEIVDFIKKSMKEANINGNRLTAVNIEKINGKFTGLLRKKRTSAGFENKVKAPEELSTTELDKSSIRFSSLKNGIVVYYSNNYKSELKDEEVEAFEHFMDEFPRKQFKQCNVYNLKTPLSLVFTNREPETKFVEMIIKDNMSAVIDSWIKSRDVGFYKISYILKRGSSPKDFNPDFFLKIGKHIVVVETKADRDISKENYSKYIDAMKHFALLNKELEKQGKEIQYHFNILSPSSYPDFEKKLLDGTYFNGFRSEIEAQLLEAFKNKND